jgi:hypothetical protein
MSGPGTQAQLDATIARLDQSLVDSLANQQAFKRRVHAELSTILANLAACADAVARVGPSAAPAAIDLRRQIDAVDRLRNGVDGHRLDENDVEDTISNVRANAANIRFDTEANRANFVAAPPGYPRPIGYRRPIPLIVPRSGSDGSARSDGTGTSRGWLSGFPSLFGSTSSRSPARSSEDGFAELRDIARPASAGISSDRPPSAGISSDRPPSAGISSDRPPSAGISSRPANYSAPLDPRLGDDPFGIGHTTDAAWRSPLNSSTRRPGTGGRTRKRRR